jgi:ribose transport system permease protein
MASPATPSVKAQIASWFGRQGMLAVLVMLGGFFSLATLRDETPVGSAAAEQEVRRLGSPKPGDSFLVIARDTDEDRTFATAAESAAVRAGWISAGITFGEPRDARVRLQQLAATNAPLRAILTLPECASWPVLTGLAEKYPTLGSLRVLTPESTRWPVFLTRQNLLNVANQIVVVAILSVGLTLVILTGGIDLSVGSLVALAAVLSTRLVRDHLGGIHATPTGLVLAALAGILPCVLIGALSGWLRVAFRLPAFISTLAVMQATSGLAFLLSKGQSIYELPDTATWLGRGTGLFGLPHAVVLTAVVYGVAHLFLTRSLLGRHLYAVGGNENAARLSGVPVGRVHILAYAASAGLAGLGGIVLTSQLKSGSPTYGTSYELYAIAAVVVGGARLSGGEGTVAGTLIGAWIIAVINNGMNLIGVESYTQKVVLGGVILGAVLIDRLKHRGSSLHGRD